MGAGAQLFVNIASIAAGAILGYVFAALQRRIGRIGERRQAAAVLRLEGQLNETWLAEIKETRIWLRDESFVEMKNKGYVAYLAPPLPDLALKAYGHLYALNDALGRDRGGNASAAVEVDRWIDAYRTSLVRLRTELDRQYPKLSANFQPQV